MQNFREGWRQQDSLNNHPPKSLPNAITEQGTPSSEKRRLQPSPDGGPGVV